MHMLSNLQNDSFSKDGWQVEFVHAHKRYKKLYNVVDTELSKQTADHPLLLPCVI